MPLRWLAKATTRNQHRRQEPDEGRYQKGPGSAEEAEGEGDGRRHRTAGEERLFMLGVLALLLHSAGTIDELLGAFLDRAPDITGCPFVLPLLIDEKRDLLVSSWLQSQSDPRLDAAMDAFQEDLTALEVPLSLTGPMRQLVDQGEVVVDDSFERVFRGVLDPEIWEQAQQQLGIERVALVPMAVEGEAMGLLVFAFRTKDIDVEVLEILSAHFTLALRALLTQESSARFSDVDPVTWVHNRRYLMQAIDSEIQRAGRYTRAVSLVVLDIDDFGAFNATYGQSMGDRLLRNVGLTLAETTSPPEVVARIKDDEFAVLLPETNRAAAVGVTTRLLASLSQVSAFAGDDEREPLTASVAIVCFPEDGSTARQLLQNALADLEQAKRERREELKPPSRPSLLNEPLNRHLRIRTG